MRLRSWSDSLLKCSRRSNKAQVAGELQHLKWRLYWIVLWLKQHEQRCSYLVEKDCLS
jgi:hypothetical protein